ncbi:preprotein translocase subunit SecG [Arenimonas fontis]|uniref:Protein-export membrane protein SecG n=1 Tax=Arenimonas fontis TaxID=2608255 RepID=A0A5B2ZBZ7_9GAMM|nr:preprotein translocase subunit SecG [Arenimonas fontis]KAA2286198.1 preprotein translocase subunit SecG [Arenimonas fontis]
MLLTIVSVVYVLVAVAMIVFILMQRGAGAAAGSGFGAGASATVFGARGSANFLSSATKWLAIVFMAMSLGMAWYAGHGGRPAAPAQEDIGAMAEVPATPAGAASPSEPPAGEIPAAAEVPAIPAASGGDVPAAGQAPASAGDQAGKEKAEDPAADGNKGG